MNCPNCAKPVPDAAVDCLSCGVIFSKWRTRAQPAEAPPALPASPAAPTGTSPSTKRLIGGAVLFAWIAYAVYVSTTMSAKRDEARRRMDAIRREHQSREAMDRTVRQATAIRP